MDEKEKEFLASQIGDLGGVEPTSNNLSGQKLKRKGTANKMDEKEKESVSAMFDEVTRNTKVFQSGERQIGQGLPTREDEYGNEISRGWIPIDRDGLKKRSMFYPEDWQFRIKTATIDAVKRWSQIEENRRDTNYVVNQVFNEVVKQCSNISTPTGNLNWMHLNSWDRFWFIMKIREYTYSNNNSINITDACESCGDEIEFNLTSDALYYEFPDDEIIEKHWNAEKQYWEIDPKEYDVDGPVIKLYNPTLGKDDMILQWAFAQAQSKKQIDELFLKFLPWLLPKAPKDIELLDKMIKEYYRHYKQWSLEMFDFMDEIIRNININPEDRISTICPNCGVEVHSTVQFQSGIKSLFPMETRHKKFGSK